MASKKKGAPRRVPKAATPRMYSDGRPSQSSQPDPGAVKLATPQTPPVGARASAGRVPNAATSNYDYVIKDLRRLAVVAAAMFAILIGLSIVIP